mmetsp:Transcript_64826/g.146205  ORF Transcript_64826/g.146205 Transcript_64826/m.146205 type:complete len:228 (+) Transcript_64826:782-1465(+)
MAGPCATRPWAQARACEQMSTACHEQQSLTGSTSPCGTQEWRQVRNAREHEGLRCGLILTHMANLRGGAETAGRQGGDETALANGGAASQQLWLEEPGPGDCFRHSAGCCTLAGEHREESVQRHRETGTAAHALEAGLRRKPASAQCLLLCLTLLLVPCHLFRDERLGSCCPWETDGRAQLVRLERQACHGRPRPVRGRDEGLLAKDQVNNVGNDEEDPGNGQHEDN